MGNDMWHVALKPGTTELQDIIVANLSASEFETIGLLLATKQLEGKVFEMERGNYLFMYGGEYERPFPSVIIWRCIVSEEECIIDNMRQEDAWILKHIWREWLMPEDTDAAYVPPESFLVMARQCRMRSDQIEM